MASEASTPPRQDSRLTSPGGLSNDAKVDLFYSVHGIEKLCREVQNDTEVIAEQIKIASWKIGLADPVKMNTALKKVIAASTATLANAQKLVDKLELITGAGEGNTREPISDGLGAALVTQSESTILSNMAEAALATFSPSERRLYHQGFVDSGDRYATITGILRRRVPLASLEQL